MTVLLLMLVLATTLWVGVDASKRDWSREKRAADTAGWVIGCLLLWIVVFPYYLAKRRSAPIKSQ